MVACARNLTDATRMARWPTPFISHLTAQEAATADCYRHQRASLAITRIVGVNQDPGELFGQAQVEQTTMPTLRTERVG